MIVSKNKIYLDSIQVIKPLLNVATDKERPALWALADIVKTLSNHLQGTNPINISYIALPEGIHVHGGLMNVTTFNDAVTVYADADLALDEKDHFHDVWLTIESPQTSDFILNMNFSGLSFRDGTWESHFSQFTWDQKGWQITFPRFEAHGMNNRFDVLTEINRVFHKGYVSKKTQNLLRKKLDLFGHFSFNTDTVTLVGQSELLCDIKNFPEITTTIKADEKTAHLHVHIPAFQFDTFQKLIHLPKRILRVRDISKGVFEGSIDLLYNGIDWQNKINVRLKDLCYKNKILDMQELNMDIKGTLSPLYIDPCNLHIHSLRLGSFFLDDLKSIYAFDQKHVLKETKAKTLGGSIYASSFEMGNFDDGVIVYFDFNDIDLGQLLDIPQIQELSGKGTMMGHVEFLLSPHTLAIRNAKIKSSKNQGVIRYKGFGNIEGNPFSPGKMAFNALEDLHFTKFDMTVFPTKGEEQNMEPELESNIILHGNNPKILNGQVFHFNIHADGQIKDLVTNSIRAFNAEEQIEEVKQALLRKKKDLKLKK